MRRERLRRPLDHGDERDCARPHRGREADVDEDEPPGKVRPVLKLADSHLQEEQEQQRAGALGVERPPLAVSDRCRRRRRGRARRRSRSRGRARRPPRGGATAARRLRSPGCGPAAVETIPVRTRASSAPAPTKAPRRIEQRQPLLRPPALERDRLDRDDDARGEHRQREEEVRHDEQRVEIRVDRDRAERRLRERADERRERQPPNPAWQSGVNRAPIQATSVAKIVTALTIGFRTR